MDRKLHTLVLMGIKQSGTYEEAALSSVEEVMTADEYTYAVGFLSWLRASKLTVGHGNVSKRFAEYQKFVNEGN